MHGHFKSMVTLLILILLTDEENKESIISIQGDNLTKLSDISTQEDANKAPEEEYVLCAFFHLLFALCLMHLYCTLVFSQIEPQQSTSVSQRNPISTDAGNKMLEDSAESPPAEGQAMTVPEAGAPLDKDLTKKKYKKKVRERRMMQVVGSDSDSSRSFPTRSKVSSSSSPMSLRSTASVVREKENGRKIVPTPPSGNAGKQRRNRKVASPKHGIVNLDPANSRYQN